MLTFALELEQKSDNILCKIVCWTRSFKNGAMGTLNTESHGSTAKCDAFLNSKNITLRTYLRKCTIKCLFIPRKSERKSEKDQRKE